MSGGMDALGSPYPVPGEDSGELLRCLCGSPHWHAIVNYDSRSFTPTGVGQPDRCAKCGRPADAGPQFLPDPTP